MRWRVVMMAGLVLVLGVMLGSARAESSDFSQWQQAFRSRAEAEGIAPATLDAAFDGLELDEQVITLDRKQPENTITLKKYLANTVSDRRIRIGREMLATHRELLDKLSAQYGVPPEYILALWGIESDYGNHPGNFSVVQSLATLAFEGRRADFFAKELVAALKIVQQEQIAPADLTGSWAGAMGDCQFIPSTYLRYAADGDGDGKRDIWGNPADIFASIAHYLQALGWQADLGWGEPVIVPDDMRESELDIKHAQPAGHWKKRGLRSSPGAGVNLLDRASTPLYAIAVGDAEAHFLVTDNFQALLQWNRSRYFATAVGTLADRIAGR